MNQQEPWADKFDKLNIHVSPARDADMVKITEKVKLFMPIAFALLKPSMKSFTRATLAAQKEEIRKRVEGMRKEVKIVSSGTGVIDGHVDFEALRHNSIIEDVLKILE